MTKNKFGIKCLPIGSNGKPAGVAQEYGTTPNTAFNRHELLKALKEGHGQARIARDLCGFFTRLAGTQGI
mgnify:CR=1 FL=1